MDTIPPDYGAPADTESARIKKSASITYPKYKKWILHGRYSPGQKVEQLPEPLSLGDAVSLNSSYLAMVVANIRSDASVPEFRKLYPTGVFTPVPRSRRRRTK